MKVLLINGSPRKTGNTFTALTEIAQTLQTEGIDSEIVWIENKPAAALAICRRGGATAAMQCLQMPLQMMNMPVVTSQYWNIAYGLAHNLAWMLRGLRSDSAPAIPDREEWQPMHFIR